MGDQAIHTLSSRSLGKCVCALVMTGFFSPVTLMLNLISHTQSYSLTIRCAGVCVVSFVCVWAVLRACVTAFSTSFPFTLTLEVCDSIDRTNLHCAKTSSLRVVIHQGGSYIRPNTTSWMYQVGWEGQGATAWPGALLSDGAWIIEADGHSAALNLLAQPHQRQ